jgi:hypothetical protein
VFLIASSSTGLENAMQCIKVTEVTSYVLEIYFQIYDMTFGIPYTQKFLRIKILANKNYREIRKLGIVTAN